MAFWRGSNAMPLKFHKSGVETSRQVYLSNFLYLTNPVIAGER